MQTPLKNSSSILVFFNGFTPFALISSTNSLLCFGSFLKYSKIAQLMYEEYAHKITWIVSLAFSVIPKISTCHGFIKIYSTNIFIPIKIPTTIFTLASFIFFSQNCQSWNYNLMISYSVKKSDGRGLFYRVTKVRNVRISFLMFVSLSLRVISTKLLIIFSVRSVLGFIILVFSMLEKLVNSYFNTSEQCLFINLLIEFNRLLERITNIYILYPDSSTVYLLVFFSDSISKFSDPIENLQDENSWTSLEEAFRLLFLQLLMGGKMGLFSRGVQSTLYFLIVCSYSLERCRVLLIFLGKDLVGRLRWRQSKSTDFLLRLSRYSSCFVWRSLGVSWGLFLNLAGSKKCSGYYRLLRCFLQICSKTSFIAITKQGQIKQKNSLSELFNQCIFGFGLWPELHEPHRITSENVLHHLLLKSQ